MSSKNIGAVGLVIVLALAAGLLGLLQNYLYAVGVVLLFIGSVGGTVLAGDCLIRYVSKKRPPI